MCKTHLFFYFILFQPAIISKYFFPNNFLFLITFFSVWNYFWLWLFCDVRWSWHKIKVCFFVFAICHGAPCWSMYCMSWVFPDTGLSPGPSPVMASGICPSVSSCLSFCWSSLSTSFFSVCFEASGKTGTNMGTGSCEERLEKCEDDVRRRSAVSKVCEDFYRTGRGRATGYGVNWLYMLMGSGR